MDDGLVRLHERITALEVQLKNDHKERERWRESDRAVARRVNTLWEWRLMILGGVTVVSVLAGYLGRFL